MLFHSGMSVSTGATFGLIQLFYLDEIALFVLGKQDRKSVV